MTSTRYLRLAFLLSMAATVLFAMSCSGGASTAGTPTVARRPSGVAGQGTAPPAVPSASVQDWVPSASQVSRDATLEPATAVDTQRVPIPDSTTWRTIRTADRAISVAVPATWDAAVWPGTLSGTIKLATWTHTGPGVDHGAKPGDGYLDIVPIDGSQTPLDLGSPSIERATFTMRISGQEVPLLIVQHQTTQFPGVGSLTISASLPSTNGTHIEITGQVFLPATAARVGELLAAIQSIRTR